MKAVLLGNEAIAYGAVEAGLGFASGYPGTPSTEIIETLFRLSKKYGFYVEWSVNEKVALEAAYGAAISGVKSLVAMKHVGLNVALDPFTSCAYTGVEAPLVVVSADDPSMWSSQNEQDNRMLALRSFVPVLEAGSIHELKDVTKHAFQVSERFKHPVMLRTTTRLSHARAVFEIKEPAENIRYGKVIKDPKRYTLLPANARVDRVDMLNRWREIEGYFNEAPFNKVEGEGKALIITSGVAYSYVKDALSLLKLKDSEYKILKLVGMVPIPRRLILRSLEEAERALVVEELEPLLETHVKALAYDHGFSIKIVGKDLIPQVGELTLERALRALSTFFKVRYPFSTIRANPEHDLPPRPPILCPGCPHRGSFYALKVAVAKSRVKAFYSGDIGCYTLGFYPPFNVQDTCIEMGGSIGLACGLAHTLRGDEIPIAIIGDSTFFHAGLPPLLNAVYNKARMLVLVLDNKVVAMTGGQPTPGTGYYGSGEEAPTIPIDEVCKGLGIEYIVKYDPFDITGAIRILVEALNYVKDSNKPCVVVGERACTLIVNSIARRMGVEIPLYGIDLSLCKACGICYNAFSCPAIAQLEDKRAYIDANTCAGCGECVHVCPYGAIVNVKPWTKEYQKLYEQLRRI